jgi:ADP-heptose:LPS heptosyltransferase
VTLVEALATRDDLELVVVGGADTVELAGRMEAQVPKIRNFANKLRLRETFALVSAADLIVANSNMVLHVAAAFGKRTIVLLGPLYSSSQVHQVEWGYDTTTVLGKESGHPEIYRPEEALDVIQAALKSARQWPED